MLQGEQFIKKVFLLSKIWTSIILKFMTEIMKYNNNVYKYYNYNI